MRRRSKGQIAIGISGWTYPPWRGIFYPKAWPQKRELEYASTQVNSIEINGTFYSLQSPKSFRAWYAATPEHFVFSVKAPRYITHIRRLSDVATPVANFFASGLLCLKEKLGPILWQLPPSLPYDPAKMETFLKLLPGDTKEASKLAHQHDSKVKGRAVLKTEGNRRLRHAMEVRHGSFQCPEFISQLRKHNVALVVADTAGKWPFMEDVTSDFIYLRLHGDEELYASGYTAGALKQWADKIRKWTTGGEPPKAKLTASRSREKVTHRDIFVYFDNDVKVRAPFDAMSLAYRLGIADAPPAMPATNEVKKKVRRLVPRAKWESGDSKAHRASQATRN